MLIAHHTCQLGCKKPHNKAFVGEARQSGKQGVCQQGRAHPGLGGLNVKAGLLHSWPGWRASEAHLVIHVCVIHVTCNRQLSLADITHTPPTDLCIPSGQQRLKVGLSWYFTGLQLAVWAGDYGRLPSVEELLVGLDVKEWLL